MAATYGWAPSTGNGGWAGFYAGMGEALATGDSSGTSSPGTTSIYIDSWIRVYLRNNIEYDPTCKGRLSNPRTQMAVVELGNELDADRNVVTGADRTREQHQELIDAGKTETPYEKTQHGSEKGYKAADVQYFNEKGEQIAPLDVAKTAEGIPDIGGIGVYDTFTHIDTRGRKADGSVWGWDSRSKK